MPSLAVATLRTSSSLPTQAKTTSAARAASAGVAAISPPYLRTHRRAFALVRL